MFLDLFKSGVFWFMEVGGGFSGSINLVLIMTGSSDYFSARVVWDAAAPRSL